MTSLADEEHSEENPNIGSTISDDGPFYEDFKVGQIMVHSGGRTITDADNIWFTLLTCNNNPLHYNQDYTKQRFASPPFNGRLVVNSLLVLSIVLGLSVKDTSKNGILLEITTCRISNPTFAGDTLYSRTEVIGNRESKSHPDMGIVTIRTKGVNQNHVQVVEFERTFMVRKRKRNWK